MSRAKLGDQLVALAARPGGGPGHVLVVHNRAVNDTTKALSAVSLATCKVTATIPIESTSFGTPAISPRGVTAVGVGPTVAALSPDGRLTALPVGSADFFGNPS